MILAPVKINDNWGYINTDGEIVLSPQWENAGNFSEGLAPVQILKKWGYIDASGRLAILPKWDYANPFVNGMAIVTTDCSNSEYESCRYIRKDGYYPFFGTFSWASNFNSDGIACVQGPLTVFYRYINTSGLPCLPKPRLVTPGSDLFAFKDKKTGKYGYKNLIGQIVIPAQFGYAYDFSQGLGRVTISGKYGYINSEGKLTIPCIYDRAEDYSCGMGLVRMNNKYGYINSEGKLTVPCIYDWAEDYSCGMGLVRMNNKYGFVNLNGEPQIPCTYKAVRRFTDVDSTND